MAFLHNILGRNVFNAPRIQRARVEASPVPGSRGVSYQMSRTPRLHTSWSGVVARAKGVVKAAAALVETPVQATKAPILCDDGEKIYTNITITDGAANCAKGEVRGTHNLWAASTQLRPAPDRPGTLQAMVPMSPGWHQFKYCLGGKWLHNPCELAVVDREGWINNSRIVSPNVLIQLPATLVEGGEQLAVVGDWDAFQQPLEMRLNRLSGNYEVKLQLPVGGYCYHFVVNGRRVLHPHLETMVIKGSMDGDEEHTAWTGDAITPFQLYYWTGWKAPVLHYRLTRDGKPVSQAWQQLPMHTVHRNKGVTMAALLPPSPDMGLEFYVSNGGGEEDHPKRDKAELYRCSCSGSVKLEKGIPTPFKGGDHPRVLLSSDIDGTMISDDDKPGTFTSSAAFNEYWCRTHGLTGSVLVYNTGRSVGSVTDLLERSGGELAPPAWLVTAVGTKVFKPALVNGQPDTSGMHWTEDTAYTATLDEGWDLEKARRLVAAQVAAYGRRKDLLKVSDDGSEHRHRLGLVAACALVPAVRRALEEGLRREGVQARVIVSGIHSHRHVDVVPLAAGKEAALQYVRRQLGITSNNCVAVGDSGNDMLMLQGEHPAIVVHNVQPDLAEWMHPELAAQKEGKRKWPLHYADASHAAGIVEGLKKIFPDMC